MSFECDLRFVVREEIYLILAEDRLGTRLVHECELREIVTAGHSR
jgi:hypothetical protein